MSYNIHFSCVSHIGNVRKINQDNLICDNNYIKQNDCNTNNFHTKGVLSSEKSPIFGVFDGMGGEDYGEIASYIASKTASEINFTKNTISDLTNYCFDVNKKICEKTIELSAESMGTTAGMLVFENRQIVLCNIGDTKIFRFVGNTLEQISKDHVAIAPFGKKPPLSQNLGIPPELLTIDPYFSIGKVNNNDIYLICSDGLTDMLSEQEIKDILISKSINDAVDNLLEKALANGGKDNITIILCKIEGRNFFNFEFKNLWKKVNDNVN